MQQIGSSGEKLDSGECFIEMILWNYLNTHPGFCIYCTDTECLYLRFR